MFLCLLEPGWAASRLAIIGGDELKKEVLFLTSALSREETVELLERSDVSKILTEQTLTVSGMVTKEALHLGKLLHADGLVILEKRGESLWMRLIAVEAGAVIAFSSSPYPKEGAGTEWSEAMAEQLRRHLSKLKPSAGKATPVSLMRITSATGGREAEILEGTVYQLLSAGLMAMPDVLVLERARLHDAVIEKIFAVDESPFWSSAWVIHGSITRLSEGFSMRLQLQPPDGRPSREAEVTADALPEMIAEVQRQVAEVIGSSTTTWDAAAESRRFADEALWAGRIGAWQNAVRSLEAAVALGDRRPETLRNRWLTYYLMARGHNSATGSEAANFMARALEVYGDALTQKALPTSGWPTLSSESGSPLSLPRPFTGQLRHVPSMETDRRPVFMHPLEEEGDMLLSTASVMLSGKVSMTAEAAMQLRQQVVSLYQTLVEELPHLHWVTSAKDQIPPWNSEIDPKTVGPRALPMFGIYYTRIRYGLFWEPEGNGYRDFVKACIQHDLPADPHFYQRVILQLTESDRSQSTAHRERFRKEWEQVALSLLREPDLRQNVAGAIILARTVSPLQGIGFFLQRRELIHNGTLPVGYAMAAFPNHIDAGLIRQAYPNEKADRITGLIKELLISLMEGGFRFPNDLCYRMSSVPFTKKQGSDILAALEAYQQRLNEPIPANTFRNVSDSLSHRAGVRPPATVADSAARRVKPIHELPTQRAEVAPTGDALRVERFWEVKNYDALDKPGAIRFAQYAGGKIWILVEAPKPGPKKGSEIRRRFIALDLPSLKHRTLFREDAPGLERGSRRVGPSFVTDGTRIYDWKGNCLRVIEGNNVREIMVAELSDPFLWLVDGQIYAADAEGVFLRVNPATGHYEVLASSRRRPAENQLDATGALRQLNRVFRGADGQLMVQLGGGQYYRFDDATREWRMVPPPQLGDADIAAIGRNAWEVGGTMAKEGITAYLRRKDMRRHALGARAIMATDGKERLREMRSLMMINAVTVADGIIWGFERDMMEGDWLQRRELAGESVLRRPLVFEKQASAWSGDSWRLIVTSEGIVLYCPGDPILWFIPHHDLVSAFTPQAPSSHAPSP